MIWSVQLQYSQTIAIISSYCESGSLCKFIHLQKGFSKLPSMQKEIPSHLSEGSHAWDTNFNYKVKFIWYDFKIQRGSFVGIAALQVVFVWQDELIRYTVSDSDCYLSCCITRVDQLYFRVVKSWWGVAPDFTVLLSFDPFEAFKTMKTTILFIQMVCYFFFCVYNSPFASYCN